MLETVVAIGLLALMLVIGFAWFGKTKSGKRLYGRLRGTATEAFIRDGSTPEGAKAHYNEAIDDIEETLRGAQNNLSFIGGKVLTYEEQLYETKQRKIECEQAAQKAARRNTLEGDEEARTWLREIASLEERIETLTDSLRAMKDKEKEVQEYVANLDKQLEDLKAEKENAVLALEMAQTVNAIHQTGTAAPDSLQNLDKVRQGVQRVKEQAAGQKRAHDNSPTGMKQKYEKNRQDSLVEDRLAALKKQ